jgi:hypothetical protein
MIGSRAMLTQRQMEVSGGDAGELIAVAPTSR